MILINIRHQFATDRCHIMSGVSGASGASSSNNSSSFSESDSSNDSQSDLSSVSSVNDDLSSSRTTSDDLANSATTQQQLTAGPTVEERIAAERTTAEQLMGVDASQATQSPADVKADEMIANHSRTINMRGGNPSVQRLDTQSLAHDVVQLSHTSPQLAKDVNQSLANKLSDIQYESFSTQLDSAYRQQAQAYQNLAGDQLTGTIEVDATAASELADKLMDNATTVSRTRSGSARENLDINELSYQLEAAAKQDPTMAMAAKMTIDDRLSANQLGELNRLVGGGDTFVDNMSLAVSHPVEGLVGAGKNFANGLSDLSEFAIQGFGYYGAARVNHSAAMVSLTNPELGQQLFDQAAVSIEEVKKIDVPSFELTNRAQRGGAVIGTAAELATGVGALVKGGIKLATKADDIVEIVVRSQDDAAQAANNLPVQRPSWRQSELDVGTPLEQQGFRPQISFKDGEVVEYGTKGSTRPEYYRSGISVEVKNYNVETAQGRSNLVRNLTTQAQHRAENLPDNTVQQVYIDVRGQHVSRAELNDMVEKIVDKSNGILSSENINILR